MNLLQRDDPIGPQLAACFAVVLLVICTVAVVLNWKHAHKDYGNDYEAAVRVLHGDSAYAARRGGAFDFIYPPAAAAMLAPLCAAGPFAFALVLIAATTLAWIVSVWLSVHLVTGGIRSQHPLLYVVPVVCTLPYVWDIYVLGQPNLALLALMLGAFACLRLRREYSAGAMVAAASAIKAFPIAALVYLIYRRHWRAAVSTVVVLAALLLILPAPFRGFRGAASDLVVWSGGMLHVDATRIGQRAYRSYSWQNQSVMGVAHRFLRHVDADAGRRPPRPMFLNIADLSLGAVNGIVLLAIGGLGVAYLLAMPRRRRRTPDTDAIEWALLLVLILICSPYLFGYFNCWLLFPFTVLARRIELLSTTGSRRHVFFCATLVSCLILLALSIHERAFDRAQAMGNGFWSYLLLFGVLCAELRQADRTAPPPPPRPPPPPLRHAATPTANAGELVTA